MAFPVRCGYKYRVRMFDTSRRDRPFPPQDESISVGYECLIHIVVPVLWYRSTLQN